MSSAPNTLRFAAAPIDSSAAAPPRMPGLDWLRVSAWAGTIAVSMWFLLGWIVSGWQARHAVPAPAEWVAEARRMAARLGLGREVEIRQARDEGSPRVVGFFTSVVLLPPSAAEWPPADRQAALVHELTHIRRADRRSQALAHAACAVYWFNPLVWRAASALARERERACDDEVLRHGARPSAYASLLLELARASRSWMPSTALSMARPSPIEGRLVAILSATPPRPRPSSRWVVLAASLVVSGATLGARLAPVQEGGGIATTVKPAAAAAGAELLDLDGRQTPPSITDTLVRALGDADGQVREKAALGLALTPGPEVIAPLLTALKDPDSQVREKAAIGLAFRRDPRVVGPLLEAIADDDAQVREKAAIALGASGDPRAAAALRKAADDPDSQVREKAVAGLLLLRFRQ